MIDLEEFLRQHKLVADEEKNKLIENFRILESRNRLLATARGSVRQHLQQQLAEALRKFDSDEVPTDPRKIC